MINWADGEWSYLLGVVHGDGHISKRSIQISVGYKDEGYANVLFSIWEKLGYKPKVYRQRSALRIDVHSTSLRDEFFQYKQGGIWAWPKQLDKIEYLSGVFDTDGYASLSFASSSPSKQVGITLKRSGNLVRLAEYMEYLGIHGIKVKDTTSNYKGRKYEIEIIRISDADRISKICSLLNLRNSRKAAMFKAVHQYANEILNRIPLWKEVGFWLEAEGAKDWREIADKFNLKKSQADSVIQYLKRQAEIRAIPPTLTKYEVIGWKTNKKSNATARRTP